MKKGRELELLISKLEMLYAGKDVIIRSPDFLMGTQSGKKREIDVTLTSNVGSAKVIIAFECKDHGRPLDIITVEGLISKFEDVSVNRGIIVSSSGYTDTAINKAKQKGVETRTLKEVLSTELDWLTLPVGETLTPLNRTYRLQNDQGTIAEGAEFSLDALAKGASVSVNRDADGKKFIFRLRRTPKK